MALYYIDELVYGSLAFTFQINIETSRLCSDALQSIEYFKLDHEGIWTYRFLKDVLVRASLTEGEVQRFEKIFTKMSRIKKHKEATDV